MRGYSAMMASSPASKPTTYYLPVQSPLETQQTLSCREPLYGPTPAARSKNTTPAATARPTTSAVPAIQHVLSSQQAALPSAVRRGPRATSSRPSSAISAHKMSSRARTVPSTPRSSTNPCPSAAKSAVRLATSVEALLPASWTKSLGPAAPVPLKSSPSRQGSLS